MQSRWFSTELTYKLLKSRPISPSNPCPMSLYWLVRHFLPLGVCMMFKMTEIFQKTLLYSFFCAGRGAASRCFIARFCTLWSKLYEDIRVLSKILIQAREKPQNFREICTLITKKEEKTIGAQQKIFSRQARSL